YSSRRPLRAAAPRSASGSCRAAEPARATSGGELALLLGDGERRRRVGGGRRRTGEEVDVGLADRVVAHLDVARDGAGERRRRIAAAQLVQDHVRDGPRLAFGDDTRTRHWRAGDVADGI